MVRDPTKKPSFIVNIPSYEGYGEDKQYRELWNRYDESADPDEEEWYCVTCGARLGRQEEAKTEGYEQRTFHHLVKQKYFPSPYQINRGSGQNRRALRSRHHQANVVPMCTSCHYSEWEGWENGRPHIMTWLFSHETGQEIDLALWASQIPNSTQRVLWSSAEVIALRQGDYSCRACGQRRRRKAVKRLYSEGRVKLMYAGPDVRAVHVIPPTEAPELAHVPRNLVLLCWDCLFGQEAMEGVRNRHTPYGWKDESTQEWVSELAPELYLEYASHRP